MTGVNAPLAMVQPKGDSRMFVIEQWGRVKIIENGQLNATPFLDIRNLIVDQHRLLVKEAIVKAVELDTSFAGLVEVGVRRQVNGEVVGLGIGF